MINPCFVVVPDYLSLSIIFAHSDNLRFSSLSHQNNGCRGVPFWGMAFRAFSRACSIDQAAGFPGIGVDRAIINADDLAASYDHILPDGVDVIANLQA